MSGWRRMADRISVVVISRNEGNELRRTVENFDHTLPEGSEIIVVDDGSTDGSANQVRTRRGRIRLYRVENYGVARARNAGARQARGGVIVYADAHLRLEADWWRPMLDLLQDPTVGGVAPAIVGFRAGQIGYGSPSVPNWRSAGFVAGPVVRGRPSSPAVASPRRNDRSHGRLGHRQCSGATSITRLSALLDAGLRAHDHAGYGRGA
jgi:glycosyltransferase involved in cell wall biosynthesis